MLGSINFGVNPKHFLYTFTHIIYVNNNYFSTLLQRYNKNII